MRAARAVLFDVRVSYARIIAVCLFAAAGVGCGGSAHLTLLTTHADTDSITVLVRNTGDGSTGPLTLSVTTDDVYNIDDQDCYGHSLGPGESCFVRIAFVETAVPKPDGTLIVDDRHGRHATTTLRVVLTPVQLVVELYSTVKVTVTEGDTAAAKFTVSNPGALPSGPIRLDFPDNVNIVDDDCTGKTLVEGIHTCSFSVAYTAPLGQYAPVSVTGTINADPGGSTPVTAFFTIDPILSASDPLFGSAEPAGGTSYVQIDSHRYPMPIGPLQLSFVGESSNPAVDYPPFILVAGQDMCSGQTLTATKDMCSIVIGLDPRLPAGGSYRSTLLVQAGFEMLKVPLAAGRGTP